VPHRIAILHIEVAGLTAARLAAADQQMLHRTGGKIDKDNRAAGTRVLVAAVQVRLIERREEVGQRQAARCTELQEAVAKVLATVEVTVTRDDIEIVAAVGSWRSRCRLAGRLVNR
jgi:ABC-type phosphonate transport system ATPase subunit